MFRSIDQSYYRPPEAVTRKLGKDIYRTLLRLCRRRYFLHNKKKKTVYSCFVNDFSLLQQID